MSNRNNRHRQGRSRERSPLWPQNSSSSYGAGSVPRTPGSQPPPPYEPLLPDTGDWQGTSYRRCRDPSPFRIPAITTGRIAAFIIFLIVLAQAVAFVFFYDLPYKLDEYSKAVSRMRQERGVMRREERRLEGERTALQRESNRLEKERKDWEKAREDRIPQGAFWETVWPAPDCRAYGEREYWAALQNIPEDWADLDACMNTPVKIKGVTVRRPDRCGYVGGSSSIHGFWMVDWDQLDCKPWHIYVTDQGCTNPRSGIRRIEAWVVGINDKPEQDWRLLCESTPFTWNHITYNSPTHCDERAFGKKVAIWDIPDNRC